MRFFFFLSLIFCSALLFGQADSLLVNTVWEEVSDGDRKGYVLQLNDFGTFEEDAGKDYRRSAQYLMGRWTTDSTGNSITLAIDYFLGKNMLAARYRKGRDFYLTYNVVHLTQDSLELKDVITGESRSFIRTKLDDDYEDAATRRIPKFGTKDKLKFPGTGGGWPPIRH